MGSEQRQKSFGDSGEPGTGCRGPCWGQSLAHAGHQPWTEPWVPLTGEKLVVSGAATVGPSPGSGSSPHSTAAAIRSPWDDFPRVLSLPPRKDWVSPIHKKPPTASRSCRALAKALSKAWGLLWPRWAFTLSGS